MKMPVNVLLVKVEKTQANRRQGEFYALLGVYSDFSANPALLLEHSIEYQHIKRNTMYVLQLIDIPWIATKLARLQLQSRSFVHDLPQIFFDWIFSQRDGSLAAHLIQSRVPDVNAYSVVLAVRSARNGSIHSLAIVICAMRRSWGRGTGECL